MTEWMGIKTGGLYKRKGKGSRDAPLLLVVSIKPTRFKRAIIHPSSGRCLRQAEEWADVVIMMNGCCGVVELRTGCSRFRGVRWTVPEAPSGPGYGDEEAWPYKELA